MKGRKTKNRHNLVTPGMAYLEGKQAGMREVVEWLEKYKKIKPPKYQLKEWGIEK